ncbi:MAG TPA: hypothetical protein VII40_06725 [Xanthobacteraceae bacterium]
MSIAHSEHGSGPTSSQILVGISIWALRRLALYYGVAAVCAVGAIACAAAYVHFAQPATSTSQYVKDSTIFPKSVPAGLGPPLGAAPADFDREIISTIPRATTVPTSPRGRADLVALPGTDLQIDPVELHNVPVYFVIIGEDVVVRTDDLTLRTIAGEVVGVAPLTGRKSALEVRIHGREIQLPLNELKYNIDHGKLLSIWVPLEVGYAAGIGTTIPVK